MEYEEHAQKKKFYYGRKEIEQTIAYAKKYCNDAAKIKTILEKAKEGNGLNVREAAVLFLCRDSYYEEKIRTIADVIEKKNFGDRMLLTAVLNLYKNRKRMTAEEFSSRVMEIQDQGYKRLILISREPLTDSFVSYFKDCIKQCYDMKHKNGRIRRINACLMACDYDYHNFIETGTSLHSFWLENNQKELCKAWDELSESGYDDFGLTVFLRQNDYMEKLVEIIYQSQYLNVVHDIMFHEIYLSIDFLSNGEKMGDEIFWRRVETYKTTMAILRITLPHTEISMPKDDIWKTGTDMLSFGASQLYVGKKDQDGYALNNIMEWLIDREYIPSFCSACFEAGRTCDRYQALLRAGRLVDCCQSNALITFKEYLEDYATEVVLEKGERLIEKKIKTITNETLYCKLKEYLEDIQEGKRGFRI